MYSGNGVRNSYGRLAPPSGIASSTGIQAPTVTQGYAATSSGTFNQYKGEVAITQNGRMLGWGTLYDSQSGLGHVFVNGNGGAFNQYTNNSSSWIRGSAQQQGVNVQWTGYNGGLGSVNLTQSQPNPPTPPSPTPTPPPYRPPVYYSPVSYYTTTSSYAGVPQTISQQSRYTGQTRAPQSSYLFTIDGSPRVQQSSYVSGSDLVTVTTKTWTVNEYRHTAYNLYNQYATVSTIRTPWFHKYTEYESQNGSTWPIRSWNDTFPYTWISSQSTSNQSVFVGTTADNAFVTSWQQSSQSVARTPIAVTARASISPSPAKRGDTVTITVWTTELVSSVSAQFPDGTQMLMKQSDGVWSGQYLVDNTDGSYTIPVVANGPGRSASTTVTLVVSGSRYYIVPNETGSN